MRPSLPFSSTHFLIQVEHILQWPLETRWRGFEYKQLPGDIIWDLTAPHQSEETIKVDRVSGNEEGTELSLE